MTIEFLWTDQCFLLVLLISIAILIRSMRKEHVRRSFRQIFKKPIAASAGVVLLLYLLIGVLDSIHFKANQDEKTASLLDYVLSPLGDQYEKTYSAPFALTLYSTETVYKQGKAEQIYPRLNYIGSNLHTNKDVLNRVVKVIFIAFMLSLLLALASFIVFRILRKNSSLGAVQRNLGNVIKEQQLSNKIKNNSKSVTKSRPQNLYAGQSPQSSFVSTTELCFLLTLLICLTTIIACYWLSRDLHILGTGKIGQDIFYNTIKSIRTGLVIGVLTTLFMMPLALLLGVAAGYFGGFIDDVIQYLYTTLSSIPGVLLITASVLSMQTYIANHPEQFTTLAQNADARLLALCFILGVTSWTSLCRLLRAEALKLREIDFVLAAQTLGSSSFKIIRRHLLPNVMHIVVITLVLDFSFLVLAEAVLSYVGVGVSPLTISWGNMINAARLELARDPIVWWPMLAAFIFMFILVLASNLFADAVRDAFDPRQASRD
jgi:peptide/nickel transport system permease protein